MSVLLDIPHVRDLICLLDGVREVGRNKLKALCPCHTDTEPSLDITIGRDNTILMICRSCGAKGDAVCRQLGIEVRALFAQRHDYGSVRSRTKDNANGKASNGHKPKTTHPTLDKAIEAARWGIGHAYKIDTDAVLVGGRWSYHDLAGNSCFHVVRFNLPATAGKDKDYRPVHAADGGYRVGDPPGKLPLYNLPSLAAANIPFVVEGEKCADAVNAIGLVGTTSAHGAQSAVKSDWAPLAGKTVVILPDADDAGDGYAHEVADILAKLDPPATVKIVKLPGLAKGEDVFDFIEMRRQSGVEDLTDQDIRDEIMRLVDAASEKGCSVQPFCPESEELPKPDKPPRSKFPEGTLILDPKAPLPSTRELLNREFQHAGRNTLLNVNGSFYRWNDIFYVELEPDAIRQYAYRFLEKAKKLVVRGDTEKLVDFAPNQTSVNNVTDALRAETYRQPISPPRWIDDQDHPPADEIVVFPNGLLHLNPSGQHRMISKPTPAYFTLNAVDFPFTHNAPAPRHWLGFLETIWFENRQAIEVLQEWFGYVLTSDNRQQKMLLLVGPPRSGKGTIARILTAMIGIANVCGPTLSSLATNFGLWPLVGKLLAVISDARLSGRTDQAIITERLLAISGGDSVTIDRKNREPITATLPVRFMVLTNELPRLADSSGALANRFVILTLNESYLGREDTSLTDRILPELPGILLWALEGWQRLRARGYFVQPDSSEQAIRDMLDLSSPVGAFVREWCKVGPALETTVDDLFDAWGLWNKEQGNNHSPNRQVFGRDLRAAFPGLTSFQKREGDTRSRGYRGIGLTPAAAESVSVARNAKHEENGYD